MLRPTGDQFIEITRATDLAVLSIRGHIAIELALCDVILKALPEPHLLEVERLSFLLKVDLAIALRAMSKESRPLFKKLNSIRNKFAHEANASIDDDTVRELRACMSKLHREIVGEQVDMDVKPRLILEMSIAAAFFDACYANEYLVHRKLERDAMSKEIELLLKETDEYSKHPAAGAFSARVNSRLNEMKKSLTDKGEYPD